MKIRRLSVSTRKKITLNRRRKKINRRTKKASTGTKSVNKSIIKNEMIIEPVVEIKQDG